MRLVFLLRCRAIYGTATIQFISEEARNQRADELAHAGHAVVLTARVL